MYTIKKYANGRFYDTVVKNYITRPQISELLKAGKKINIIDTKTEKDITDSIVSQIKVKAEKAGTKKAGAKAKKAKTKSDSENVLVQLFRKGGDTLLDYGKKYSSMWQDLLTMSKDEIDKLVNLLVKDKKINEFEAKKLRTEIQRYRDNIQKWITKNIDQRINDVLDRMNLANRDQVLALTSKIESLNKKIDKLEKAKPKSAPAAKKKTPKAAAKASETASK